MVNIVWTLDLNFQTTYVSPSIEKVLGFTPAERKQQTLEKMVTPEYFKRIAETFSRELEIEKMNADPDRVITMAVECYHKNGTIVWLENDIKAMREPDGKLVGIYGSSRDITERILYEKSLKKEKDKLKNALEQIKTLKGLLPICSSCKKIRDDKGYWNILESYIQKHTNAQFSHSMCPECSDKFYGNEDWYIEMKEEKGSE